jgi:hypothetical protein
MDTQKEASSLSHQRGTSPGMIRIMTKVPEMGWTCSSIMLIYGINTDY